MKLDELKEDGARITVENAREYIWHLAFEEKAVRFRIASAAHSCHNNPLVPLQLIVVAASMSGRCSPGPLRILP